MDGVKVSFLGDSRDGPCRGGWGTVGRRTAGRDAGGGSYSEWHACRARFSTGVGKQGMYGDERKMRTWDWWVAGAEGRGSGDWLTESK